MTRDKQHSWGLTLILALAILFALVDAASANSITLGGATSSPSTEGDDLGGEDPVQPYIYMRGLPGNSLTYSDTPVFLGELAQQMVISSPAHFTVSEVAGVGKLTFEQNGAYMVTSRTLVKCDGSAFSRSRLTIKLEVNAALGLFIDSESEIIDCLVGEVTVKPMVSMVFLNIQAGNSIALTMRTASAVQSGEIVAANLTISSL